MPEVPVVNILHVYAVVTFAAMFTPVLPLALTYTPNGTGAVGWDIN